MFAKKLLCIVFIILGIATLVFAQSKGNIVFVSFQDGIKIDPETGESPDMPHIYALQDEGYDVTLFYNESLSTAEESTLDTLYNADLIIMGRSTPSPGYGDHKQTWNEITTPILNLELWNCRSNRLNWFNTDNMVSISEEGTIYNAIIEEEDDPVFEGWDTSAPIPWVIAPFDAVGTSDAGNGIVVARLESDGTVVFVRFEPEVEFYDGAGDWPAGHRTVIGNGRDNSGNAPFDYYNFTVESEAIFLAEVARMVALSQGGNAVNDRRESPTPAGFVLQQNYPNPFNPTTTISFELQNKSDIRLVLYDIRGHILQDIASGPFEAGAHDIVFDGGHLSSGLYVYKLMANGFVETKKMVLIK